MAKPEAEYHLVLHAGTQPWLDRPLGLLDRARARVLKRTMPWSGLLAGDRELRVGVLGVAAVTLALLGTLTVPAWLLILGPLLLGVPHLVADVRYGVVRNGLLARRHVLVPAAIAVALAGVLGMVGFGFLGALFVLLVGWEREGRSLRWIQMLAVLLTISLCVVAFAFPRPTGLVMAHLHNILAVALWWMWRPRSERWHYLVLLMIVGGIALLVLLPVDVVTLATRTPVPLEIETQVDILSGHTLSAVSVSGPARLSQWYAGLPVDQLGLRLVLLFCFLQSVHYTMWLSLIREDDRAQPTPRTFRASLHALVDDLGWPVLICSAALALLVALWAGLVDTVDARTGYLQFARFHGSLELCALAMMIAVGRPVTASTRHGSPARQRDTNPGSDRSARSRRDHDRGGDEARC